MPSCRFGFPRAGGVESEVGFLVSVRVVAFESKVGERNGQADNDEQKEKADDTGEDRRKHNKAGPNPPGITPESGKSVHEIGLL